MVVLVSEWGGVFAAMRVVVEEARKAEGASGVRRWPACGGL